MTGPPPAGGMARSATARLAAAGEQVAHLDLAVVSQRRIGMATGIPMTRLLLTEQQAFDQLRCASQHRNEKLIAIAEEVILTGAL